MLRSCSQNSFNQLLSFKILLGRGESVLSQSELPPARGKHPLHDLQCSPPVSCFVCLPLFQPKVSYYCRLLSVHFEKLERKKKIAKPGMAGFCTEILAFYWSCFHSVFLKKLVQM